MSFGGVKYDTDREGNKKILCIGFSKTGTTSLHRAFRILGIRSCHHKYRGRLGQKLIRKAYARSEPLLTYMPTCTAYSDMVLYHWYQQLASQYPNAKFILTVREPFQRARSKIRHNARWNRRHPFLRQRDASLNRLHSMAKYQQSMQQEIVEYFGQSEGFLVLDITNGDGWEKLCPFLKVDIPSVSFPFVNKSNSPFID